MELMHITKENYEEKVAQAGQPVLLEFSAPWCSYCRRIEGVVKKLPEAYADRTLVGQINIDESPELAKDFSVDIIPSFIVVRDGKASDKLIAPGSKADIDAWMQAQSV